jgi:hypothetical protein
MALRWAGAATQEAAKGFRRLAAYKQFPINSTRNIPAPYVTITTSIKRPRCRGDHVCVEVRRDF